jgi:hypothetical protein
MSRSYKQSTGCATHLAHVNVCCRRATPHLTEKAMALVQQRPMVQQQNAAATTAWHADLIDVEHREKGLSPLQRTTVTRQSLACQSLSACTGGPLFSPLWKV